LKTDIISPLSNIIEQVVGTHIIWPPDAFELGHHAHQHLASWRISKWATKSCRCVYKV